MDGATDDESKIKTVKAPRGFGDHYVWPEFEKELYSICPQRRCTFQSNGQTKNMSENFLMRKQLTQNSRKRKDKRVQQDTISSNFSDSKPGKKGRKSKQTRRVVQPVENTPTLNDKDTPVTAPGLKTLCETAVRRQLEYDASTLKKSSLNDANNIQKRTCEDNVDGVNNFRDLMDSKRPKLDVNGDKNEFSLAKESLKAQFPPGQLIWGKLKGFDWWPGMVVELKNLTQTENQINDVWVKWYGDNKFSKLLKNEIVLFRHFRSKYSPSKWKGLYKRAVVSALEVAASRSNKSFKSEDIDKPNKDDRAKLLLDWALDDFKPGGPEVFETAVQDKQELSVHPNMVDLEGAWNRREGKDRFGQPIRTPALAEDVKSVFDQAVSGIINIEDICLGCGDIQISVRHPLFHGSLCEECKETFLECVYLFDEDGYQMYCTICGDGKEVFMCESAGCFRSYCAVCLELMCGAGTVDKISSSGKWCCIMCLDIKVGLLQKREDWQEQLREIFASDKEQEYSIPKICAPIPPEKRQKLRVLSLFDGIATGLLALKELGLDVQVYFAAEIDENATRVVKVQHGEDDIVQFVGDVELITAEQIEMWGPFDLVIGASPCNDLSIANPARQGIFEGSGRLFFEFFRLLMFAKPNRNDARPFFWLFENVVSMRAVDKRTISRFLQCNPVVVDAKDISPARRARYFWGNLPGMNRPTIPVAGDKLSLQSCLEPHCGRKARFTKIQTVTTKANSMKQTKEGILPVEVSDSDVTEDLLWCTEMERLFGFPAHYTDVGNMGKNQRQKLLGKSWSVPVIRHLLAPLREYFSSKPSTKNTSNK